MVVVVRLTHCSSRLSRQAGPAIRRLLYRRQGRPELVWLHRSHCPGGPR